MFCIMNSSFMPVVSGNCRILTGSFPAIHAAAWSTRPPDAPLQTNPASAPVRRAISSPALRFNSSTLTMIRAAPVMTSSTSGLVLVPPYLVTEPAALITGFTPRRWYAWLASNCFPAILPPRVFSGLQASWATL